LAGRGTFICWRSALKKIIVVGDHPGLWAENSTRQHSTPKAGAIRTLDGRMGRNWSFGRAGREPVGETPVCLSGKKRSLGLELLELSRTRVDKELNYIEIITAAWRGGTRLKKRNNNKRDIGKRAGSSSRAGCWSGPDSRRRDGKPQNRLIKLLSALP